MRIEGDVMKECRFSSTMAIEWHGPGAYGYKGITRCEEHGFTMDAPGRCPIGRIEDLEERLARVSEQLAAIFPAD